MSWYCVHSFLYFCSSASAAAASMGCRSLPPPAAAPVSAAAVLPQRVLLPLCLSRLVGVLRCYARMRWAVCTVEAAQAEGFMSLSSKSSSNLEMDTFRVATSLLQPVSPTCFRGV